MSEVKKIEKSVNVVQIVGTLKEMNIELKKNETIKLYYGGGQNKEMTCDVYVKKDFKSPAFLIEVDGQDIPVDMNGIQFGVSSIRLDDKGVADKNGNKTFKTIESISKFTPMSECKDGEVPTRVEVSGFIKQNEYANKDGGWSSFPVVTAYGMSHTSVPDEDKIDCAISGVIKSMMPEVKMVDEVEEETGRLKIELCYFDNNENTYPMPIIVDEDLASDVEGLYEVGDSCKIYYEVKIRRVGGRPVTNEGGIGRREAKITSGFNVTEYSLFKCSDPFEEDNNLYVSVESMKSALEARKLMIETKIEDAKNKENNKDSGAKSSPKGASKGIGRREFKGSEASPF